MSRSLSCAPWIYRSLVLLVGIIGCGEVTVEDGSVQGSTSSTGSGGAGGEVAAFPPCEHLVQTGELTQLPSDPGTLSVQPKLLALGDGSTAIVRTIAIPGMGPQSTASTSIAWTGEWPPAASLPIELADRPWYVSAVSRSAPNSIALLGAPQDASPGIAFGLADPLAGGWSQLVSTDTKAFAPTFLAADDSGNFFVGMSANAGIPNNKVAIPHLGWVATMGGVSYMGPIALGCPTDPVSAAAVSTPSGWLLARSIFENDCLGPAALIEVTFYKGTDGTPAAELPCAPWAAVDLIPSPKGAWLRFEGQGVELARLSEIGALEVGPITISPDSTALAVDALDGGLVFAANHADSTDLTVGVTDEQGDVIASAPLKLPSSPNGFQIAFDAETRQALVALVLWDDPSPGPSSSVRVARFSCP
jgi:hypothetical protein